MMMRMTLLRQAGRRLLFPLSLLVVFASLTPTATAASAATAADLCTRPSAGSDVPNPPEVRSINGVLRVALSISNALQPDGTTRYCYSLPDGLQAPTLRVSPGDEVILQLNDRLDEKQIDPKILIDLLKNAICTTRPRPPDPCLAVSMTPTSTNLHFHGLTVPADCHKDDVLHTALQPEDGPFEYRFVIPANQPPGLYWYHPHIHGFSSKQVQGGASAALIVDGLERAIPAVAGLPERVLIIRDQDLLNPDAAPAHAEPTPGKMLIDRDGDAVNTGTGYGKPARDLSVNYVPVPYPDYQPAVLRVRPDQRQLWRVLNASSLTYLHLAVLFKRVPQTLEIVAIDGVPQRAGSPHHAVQTDHVGVPPGARVEFIVRTPPEGVNGLLVTRAVDTGPGGENDPNRALALIHPDPAAPVGSVLPAESAPLPVTQQTWIGDVQPARVRHLYFSEKATDPSDPNSPMQFYLTVDGDTPKMFDPRDPLPNIVTHQGDVEDWVIENRSNELHAFHIHQIHFLVMDWSGHPVQEPFLRDTVNVPYYRDNMLSYPSVRLRMDFRDPNTVGTFVYHCHLLEHEDGGMMGTIRVMPQPVH